MSLRSDINLYGQVSTKHMKYLLTYKIGQDHIELFLGKSVQWGDVINNPSARQFASAYRRILLHNDIKDVVNGNCTVIENLTMLAVSSRTKVNHLISHIN